MSVLVAGGSGFIGSHLLELLIEHEVDVISGDIAPPKWLTTIDHVALDVTSGASIDSVLDGIQPTTLVNLSGVLGTSETFDHPEKTFLVNTVGAAHLLNRCRDLNIEYLGVETGTNWLNPYAISKRAASQLALAYAEAFGMCAGVMKIYNAYGPRQSGLSQVNKVVPRFIANAIQGSPLPIFGDGNQVMDLVPVSFCADALCAAVMDPPAVSGRIVQVGTGKPTTVNQLADEVIRLVGRGQKRLLPNRIGEGTEYACADTTVIQELGVVPPDDPFMQLASTVDWYRDHLGTNSL